MSSLICTQLKTPPKILILGHALVDIQVYQEEDFVASLGLEIDKSSTGEHAQILDQLNRMQVLYQLHPAGSCLNTACNLQDCLPSHSIVHMSCIGGDDNGKLILDFAIKNSLTSVYQIVDDIPTGTCFVIITGKYRTLVSNWSAAAQFSKAYLLQQSTWQYVEDAQYYYITGFFIETSFESAIDVAKHASSSTKKKFFSINLSATYICQHFTKNLDDIIPYTDIVFGNESEARAYADAHNWDEDIALKIANIKRINSIQSPVVVITQGDKETIVATNGGIKSFKVNYNPKLINTCGAGDAFVAGFLSKFIDGESIEKSVEIGHYLASKVIQTDKPNLGH